jgi:glycosyltransferase involved in cell wall biosynthesis
MRIGYFVGHFPYPNLVNTPDYTKKYAHGGTEIAAYNLAVNMAMRGNMVDVFTTSIDSKSSVEMYPNMKVHRHGTSFKIASANPSIKLIYNPLNYDMDIVHAHSPIPYSDLPALLYAKRKKLPFVLTYQFDGVETGGSFARNAGVSLYNKLFIHKVLDSADAIIATTKSYAQESPFLRGYPDKTVVIPNGINIKEVTTPLTKEKSREILGIPQDSEIILFFGSLVEYKGPDILLKAFKLVKNVAPSAKLIFAGRGHLDSQLKEAAKKLKISGDVIFTGFVEDKDKPLYYKAADIFCLPSTTLAESFGIVNLEAMAAGIPIVSSNLGGIPDIVKNGENGLLAKPYDIEMVAENLIKLIKDDNMRHEMGQNGLKMVKSYTWDEVALKTEKLYKELIENY